MPPRTSMRNLRIGPLFSSLRTSSGNGWPILNDYNGTHPHPGLLAGCKLYSKKDLRTIPASKYFGYTGRIDWDGVRERAYGGNVFPRNGKNPARLYVAPHSCRPLPNSDRRSKTHTAATRLLGDGRQRAASGQNTDTLRTRRLCIADQTRAMRRNLHKPIPVNQAPAKFRGCSAGGVRAAVGIKF